MASKKATRKSRVLLVKLKIKKIKRTETTKKSEVEKLKEQQS